MRRQQTMADVMRSRADAMAPSWTIGFRPRRLPGVSLEQAVVMFPWTAYEPAVPAHGSPGRIAAGCRCVVCVPIEARLGGVS